MIHLTFHVEIWDTLDSLRAVIAQTNDELHRQHLQVQVIHLLRQLQERQVLAEPDAGFGAVDKAEIAHEQGEEVTLHTGRGISVSQSRGLGCLQQHDQAAQDGDCCILGILRRVPGPALEPPDQILVAALLVRVAQPRGDKDLE